MHDTIDMSRHLPADNGANETHQAFRFPEIAALDGLDHDKECIMNLVIELLRSKLAAQVIADTTRKDEVKLFHPGFLSPLDPVHQVNPIVSGRSILRIHVAGTG